jgi:hypothetical protein
MDKGDGGLLSFVQRVEGERGSTIGKFEKTIVGIFVKSY